MTPPSPFSDDELEQLRAKAETARDSTKRGGWHAMDAHDELHAACSPDTVLRLIASVEKANAERDEARAKLKKSVAAHATDGVWALELEGENARLRELVEDLRDHGLRADLNPTMANMRADGGTVYADMCRYLRRLDQGIRNRAARALALPVTEEADR